MHSDQHIDLYDRDSVENNLRFSAKGSLVTYDDTHSLTVLAFHFSPLWMNGAAPRLTNLIDSIREDKELMKMHVDLQKRFPIYHVCPKCIERVNEPTRMRIFALRDNSDVDRVMFDSGAAHSACPSDCANEHEGREVQRKIQFQTASGELLEHHVEKLVPYMAQDSVVGITYQVTDVEGLVAAVSSMNHGGMTVVFSPQGAWVCDETPLKPAGSN